MTAWGKLHSFLTEMSQTLNPTILNTLQCLNKKKTFGKFWVIFNNFGTGKVRHFQFDT